MPAATLFPLGYPVRIATESPEVLNEAAALWGSWPPLFDVAHIEITATIRPGPPPRSKPAFSSTSGSLFFYADESNYAEFDPRERKGCVNCTADALGTALFRHHLLEALVLTALDAIFFTPLHAACVSRAGAGVLLCGDSGAGKSSLAYACARRGLTLVSDDAVHLASGCARIGVGASTTIRLRPPARKLFPSLAELPAQTAPNGKQAIDIDASAHGLKTMRSAVIGQCVFLRRRPGPVARLHFDKDAAVEYFLKYLRPRDTTRAEHHLCSVIDSPLLLEYEHADDAAHAIENLI
ncbi:MAG: hypothetical protein JO307_24440 [Bryobacterales bacterium]|nr:hypothetical protein [Bryobacterales bacterium]MBV9398238.1 hypothetical protein [Bryobacterales bacterium]